MNPIVQNSQHPLKGSLLSATERILKLSVPNVYVWLCMFYCFFHLWCVFTLSFDSTYILVSLFCLLKNGMKFPLPPWQCSNDDAFKFVC